MSIKIILIVLTIFVCILSGITDLYNGKVYNKVLILFLCIGCCFAITYYLINYSLIIPFLTNLLSCVLISYIFFKLKIWGAGDSKLWITITILLPFDVYIKNDFEMFPCLRILMLVFSSAYIYVIFETIYRIIVNHKSITKLNISNINYNDIFDFIYLYLVMFTYNQILSIFLHSYYNSNQIFFAIIGFLLANKLSCIKLKPKIYLILIALIINILCLINFQYKYTINLNQQIIIFVIITISLLIKNIASFFNYIEIPTANVREGMILAYSTIINFNKSRVKGLPIMTDETTHSRITKEEANSILRWKDSKYGEETIIIVQHMPFAIFFLVGLVLYFLLSWR